ncbi:MAG TPA: DUF1361 domain-containing protein [Candidatus Saccharimonadales bacterium]|nr:DUF1361 domain-containing protein [Candidatus Saccharimonadales bacterium]
MDLLGKHGRRFGLAVGILSLADLILLGVRVLVTGSHRYGFIPWNLALAWISLLFAGILMSELKNHRWQSWQNISLTVGWLVFLPNTWYVLTDFVHIFPNGEISQLYDIVLISLLVFTGFILGFTGLFLIHRELLARLDQLKSWLLIEGVVLLSSFAIYLGRDLRWNSWDVITNPGSVIINASQGIDDPFGSPRALNVTLLFFVLINVIYLAFWVFSRPAKPHRR